MTQELTDEELMQATDEEIEFYNKCIEGLPSMRGLNGDGLGVDGAPIPYGSGPHIIKHFKEVIDIVNPKRIFEIGFNIGYSSAMWLELSDAMLLSCDISKKYETLEAKEYLRNKYGRFIFEWREDIDEVTIKSWADQYYFDLAFIDGSHEEDDIITDIQTCINMKIPFLLLDDWYPRFGETQKAVAKFPELELVKDMNNLRLYKVNY